MSNTVLLSWDKPATLADWQKEQNKPKLAPLARETLLIMWLIFIVVLAIMLIFNVGRYQFITIIVLPNAFSMYMRYQEAKSQLLNTQRHYELRQDGLLIVGGKKPKLHPWKTIRNYKIEPISELPPFSNLTVQVGPLFNREFIQLSFDPNTIPIGQLQSLLDEKQVTPGQPTPVPA